MGSEFIGNKDFKSSETDRRVIDPPPDIKLTEQTIGVWYAITTTGRDWLGHVQMRDNGTFIMQYVLREDGKREARCYEIKNPKAAIEAMRLLLGIFQRSRYKGWEVLKGARSLSDFLETLRTMPHAPLQDLT